MKKMLWLVCFGMLAAAAACDVDEPVVTGDTEASDDARTDEAVGESQDALLGEIGFDCYDGWGYDYGPLMDASLFAYAEGDCYEDPWGWGGGGDPWGGGGGLDDGGGPCAMYPHVTYSRSGWQFGLAPPWTEHDIRMDARNKAKNAAETACRTSGVFCTGYVVSFDVTAEACVYDEAAPPSWECSSTVAVECGYR